ncbi:hypothetical protein E24_00158 [Faustovirus]|nr:hypothetical protein PRJ_Fausto_00144 [Faustovirus]AMN83089.1 hypothetical protein E24_00158 [Faustovirus]AMN84071.1 hypothetical protein D5a_00157 [Faustovirus]AMN85058.1 hypothetical protein E23_00157 [Faustovirus]QBR99057.1 hypothetical protein [Faustovirus mariensis]
MNCVIVHILADISNMELLPREIITEIVIKVPVEQHIHSLPALMLTSKLFHAAVKTLYVGFNKHMINNALIEYYVLQRSKTGIDFAVDLGWKVSSINVATCLYRHLDDIRDHIVDNYGLPKDTFGTYTSAIIATKSMEYAQYMIDHGANIDTVMLSNELHRIPINILELFIVNLRQNDVKYLRELLKTFVNVDIGFTKPDKGAQLACNLKLLCDKGIIYKSVLRTGIISAYQSNKSPMYDVPELAQLAVDLYLNENLDVYVEINLNKPLMTAVLEKSPDMRLLKG